MELKNITYTGLVNLQNCEDEPIHVPGSIQPHGYLLAIDPQGIVRFCSANCSALNWDIQSLLERPLADILNEQQLQIIDLVLESEQDYTSGVASRITINGQEFNLLLHQAGELKILEFELIQQGESVEAPELNSQTFQFARDLANAESLAELCQQVARNVKEIIGFDRVMIYKFDEEYNGLVFAEEVNESYEPYLDLNYPHTDIPPQARELYMWNLVRTIPDTHYEHVPILTRQPNSHHESLNLSMSVLRSVSPIHIQYLKNMGVRATFTISIISEGRLWGLVACHNYSPKKIPFGQRVSALLQATLLGSQVKVVTAMESLVEKRLLEASLNEFQSDINNYSLNDSTYSASVSCEMVNADAFIVNSPILSIESGTAPYQKDLSVLLEILNEKAQQFFVSDNIRRDLAFEGTGEIAGLLYYKLGDGTQVLWIRKEVVKEVLWAGNPDKAVIKGEQGMSPRKSFASWKQTKTGFSRKWTENELVIAKQGVFSIQNRLAYLTSQVVQIEQAKIMEKLAKANAELENILWITSHDLQEPLRKIRMFVSLIEDDEAVLVNKKVSGTISKITRSAERMHNLLNDLLTFDNSRRLTAHNHNQPVDLNKILQDIKTQYEDLDFHINIVGDFPTIKGGNMLVKQLFSNIIDNSIKFSHPERTLRVDISYENIDEKIRILVADNGIGFDPKFEEVIFKVFKRVNNKSNIRGTGVGLSVCKKIVDSMYGNIYAKSVENEGTRIFIDLPYNS